MIHSKRYAFLLGAIVCGVSGMAYSSLAAAVAPIPCDADGDGDYDLLVSRDDLTGAGLYLWENARSDAAQDKRAMFLPARRLSDTVPHLMPSYVEGKMRVLSPGWEFFDCGVKGLQQKKSLPAIKGLRDGAQQWRYADFNGDGHQDLIVGIAFDDAAQATQSPSESSIQICFGRADGTHAEPFMLMADGKLIVMHNLPSANFAHFDADDDLDLLCATADGGFIYYENSNTNSEPLYAAGKRLRDAEGKEIIMPAKKHVPIAFDWDRDGDIDLIVGDAEGRVALVEHTGVFREHVPIFLPPVYFSQSTPQH